MKKWMLIVASVIVVLLAVGALFLVPRLRLASLERSLISEADARAKAAVARRILEVNSSAGEAILQRYADRDPQCAFDATHGVFIICDDNDGAIHQAFPPRPPIVESIRDPAVDEVIFKMTMTWTDLSVKLGDPPKHFECIRLLSVEPNQADFVLKERKRDAWHRLSFRFDAQGLKSTDSHNATDAEFEEWKTRDNWPEEWK